MHSDHLSTTFQALADPTRRAILARLALGETSVSELAEPFDISGPAISRHLKVLEHAGLIARSREAQWRRSRIELERAEGRGRLARRISPALGAAAGSPGGLPPHAADRNAGTESREEAGEETWPRQIVSTSIPIRR
jgi:DNA-binding transcriptional ArsR family regulator